jgi:endoglucanase
VLLAEPLVDDFARCFQGVGLDEAASLADSFRFDACWKRERLLDILRSAASP